MTADDIIIALELQPHPEGGYFRETFRDEQTTDNRSCSTAIYYLLKRGEQSAWHKVDAVEIWHYYAGAPLALSLSDGTEAAIQHLLGPDLQSGQHPQVVVPRDHWQSARSTGDWTLVGCTVAPGFEFSGFEMAPPGWEPGENQS
ncbi:cupin domain-containing protein [Coralliovum pocilloporae]|uniref:cupin domain-containing protein n=1 Tax=Coralliovum pocilloporae TaxID=3066369 RepID=UPI003307B94E